MLHIYDDACHEEPGAGVLSEIGIYCRNLISAKNILESRGETQSIVLPFNHQARNTQPLEAHLDGNRGVK